MTNASKELAFGSGASAVAKQVADAFINVRTWRSRVTTKRSASTRYCPLSSYVCG